MSVEANTNQPFVDRREREKAGSEFVDEALRPVQTYSSFDGGLSEEHRQYLTQRHGTYELEPLPDMNDADPYNWPQRKKVLNLALVAFHAMMATFTASAIQSAFTAIAADLDVSLTQASYLTSLQIAILGAAPLFWRPLSDRYGRRPIFLISLLFSLVGNIGCANSPTYATMGLCRAITAFFISPAAAIGSAVVAECFFKRDRARYMGVWTLLVTLGVPMAPFLFGFVAYRVGYRWIYYILAITNGIQFVLYLFLGPETRYLRSGVVHTEAPLKYSFFHFGRIDPTPLKLKDFYSPLRLGGRLNVLIPATAYAMIFLFASIMITVEIPQLFAEKFDFNTQELGLQFIAMIIGSVIGEQIGGYASDWWMRRRTGKTAAPEHRLWLSYVGILLAIVGVIIFLVRLQETPSLHYNVTPMIGGAIAAVGNQIVTTVLVTYAVDCYRDEAASVGVFITFARQEWGFIGPFWFTYMFDNVGLYGSAGIAAGLMFAVSLVPIIALHWKGQPRRK